jgi:hypothetical protein
MTSVFENEKKFRKGKKFVPKETKGGKFRKDLKEAVKELNLREKKDRPAELKSPNVSGPQKMIDNMMEDSYTKERQLEQKKFSKGGRAMYKSGMRVCKLAKRGKGRAYGKNS